MEDYIERHSQHLEETQEVVERRVKHVESLTNLLSDMHEKTSETLRKDIQAVNESIDKVEQRLTVYEDRAAKLTPQSMMDSTKTLIKNASFSRCARRNWFVKEFNRGRKNVR